MAKESHLDFYWVLSMWVMVLTCGSAERQYFHQDTNATWADARSHCQVCFKELATLTPDNMQIIAWNLSSEYWVGLRKRPVNASDNSTLHSFNDTASFWSRWANGDPLTFQNWYPGYPVLKSPNLKRDCCSCSCTCPAKPTPTTTITQNVTPTTSSNSTVTTVKNGANYSENFGIQNTTSEGPMYSVPNTTAYNTSNWTNDSVVNTSTPVTTVGSIYSVENTSTAVTVESKSVENIITPVTSVGSNYTVQPNISFDTTEGTHFYVPNTTTENTSETPDYTVLAATIRSTSHWTTSFTSADSVTFKPIESECVKSPMLFQDVPDLDENYMEDSCVAILSFGAWVEKNCSDHLPFICYEDRFIGKVHVTDITSTSATLKWEPGPGDIDHYRVEVNNSSYKVQKNLTISIQNLTAGTRYLVQVFPVKCERDLNSENDTFYTVPNQVSDLRVVHVTEECVSLNWSKPLGNVDMYLIRTGEKTEPTVTEPERTICNLKSGSLHTFSVQSGVNDRSEWSLNSTISAYTKPTKVPNLRTVKITDASLSLEWDNSTDNATTTRYLVIWSFRNGIYDVSLNKTVMEKKLEISGLPSGTRISVSVIAMANYSLQGENQTVVNFTLPEEIKDLQLDRTEKSINATWSYTKGSPNFTVELRLNNEKPVKIYIRTTTVLFDNLKSAANYTVTVYSVSGSTESKGVSKSIFTRPVRPSAAELHAKNKTALTFTWTPPPNTVTVDYVVILNSTFWGFYQEERLNNKTMCTFEALKSGTNYTFRVQTIADTDLSDPITLRSSTDPALMEITLSMICSSAQPLLCDSKPTRDSAFQELKSNFEHLLGDQVVWSLEKKEGANTGN